MTVRLKRVYEEPSQHDGYRLLVDRLWPRGITREKLHLDAWLKDLAPSTGLRKWFSHDLKKWGQFKRRYFLELDDHPEEIAHILEKTRAGRVTLVFSARDEKFNNAAALKEYLQRHRSEESSL